MKKLNINIITEEQLYKLDFIHKTGMKAAITDFSILLGGEITDAYFTNEGNELRHRTGWYWTDSAYGKHTTAIAPDGNPWSCPLNYRKIGGRPTLRYSSISDNVISKVRRPDGILEIEYGEYPQWAASYDCQLELENAYKNKTIYELLNYITTDSRRYDEYDKEFQQIKHQIYEYRGKKYIKLKANQHKDSFKLSNGISYNRNDYVWVEISPIKWLVDEKKDIALSQNIIFAGIQHTHNKNSQESFNKDIFHFIRYYLQDEIQIDAIYPLLVEIKLLKEKLEITARKNNELEKENSNYKQRIRKIQNITN